VEKIDVGWQVALETSLNESVRERWARTPSSRGLGSHQGHSLDYPCRRKSRKHPVPIEEAAIGAISNNSMAIDIYVWLAYRLHSLSKPTPLSWTAVKAPFGAGFAAMNNFKLRFLPNLRLALAVYPQAKIEDAGDKGLILYPSPPPVSKQLIAHR
jgi:hypothetical protein